MTSSVDTRVVEMKFDNASFQKGVAETLSSLDNLSEKLDGKKAFSGLDGLKNAISGISFDSIGSGLDTLLSKGSTVFNGLISSVGSFGKALMGISGIAGILMAGGGIYQAITGGAQRATNIENARFQIEGLRADWKALSEDIDFAVQGTAYGFDSAAMAAAQFTASGIEAGDAMKTALRGISGVAAMTNSSYEDISRIFTTVAGNGRLMGDQLLQLSSRGLNVAAVLADKLDTSEEEIRDMTSKGMISFELFADVMDDTFGEHATKANETFTGAVANMKAALSRIGADFITPLHEYERQAALGLRELFLATKEGLNFKVDIDHISKFGSDMEREYAGMWSIVSSFAFNIEHLGEDTYNALEKFAKSGVLQEFISSFVWISDAIFHGTWQNASAIITGVFDKLGNIDLTGFKEAMRTAGEMLYRFSDITAAQIPMVIDIFSNLVASLANIASAIWTVIGPVFEAFGSVIADFMDIGAEGTSGFLAWLSEFTAGLVEFTSTLGLSAEEMESFKEILRGIFSGIGSVLGPIFNLIGSAIGSVVGLFQNLWPALKSVGSVLKDVFGPALTFITNVLGSFIQAVADAIGKIPDFVGKFANFDKIAEFFNNVGKSIGDFLGTVNLDGFAEFTNSIGNAASGLQINSEILEKAWNTISAVFGAIAAGIGNVVTGAGSFFEGIGKAIKDLIKVDKAFADDGLEGVTQTISKAQSSIDGVGGSIIRTLSDIGKAVTDFVSNIKFEDVVTAISAIITGLMTGAGIKIAWNLGQVIKDVHKGLKGIDGIIGAAKDVLVSLSENIEGFAKALSKTATADIIKSVGISIALLAGSLFLLSMVDPNRLISAGIALGIIAAGLTVMVMAVGKLATMMTKGMDAKQMASFASQLMAFAVAIGVLAGAVALMSLSVALLTLVDPQRLQKALSAIIMLMGSIIGLAAVLGKIKASYASLLSFAAAMMAIGLAIIPLVASITFLSMLPVEQVAIGLAELALTLGVVYALVSSLGEKLLVGDAANIAAFAAAMLAIGIAIIPLVAAVTVLGSLPLLSVIQGVGALATMMVALGFSIRVMAKALTPDVALDILAASAAILAFGVAMMGIAGAVAIISSLNLDGVDKAVEAIQGIMLALGLVSGVMLLFGDGSDLLGMSVALVAFGASVAIIAGSLAILAAIPWQGMLAGIGALVLVLGVFLGIGVLLSAVIPGAAGALVVFSAAILLAGAGMALVGVGLMAFASGLAVLAVVAPSAATAIGTGMKIMAKNTAEAFVLFGETLANSSDTIQTTTAKLGSAAALGFAEAAPDFGNAGVQAVIAFATGIGQNAGAIAASGLLVIENFLIGLASGIGGIVDAAAQLAIMFIVGVGDTLRANGAMLYDAVSSVFGTIFSMLEHLIADAIESIFGPNPIADAIRANADEIGAAAEESSQKVHDAFAEKNPEIVAMMNGTMDDIAGAIGAGGDKAEKSIDKVTSGIFDGLLGTLSENSDLIPDEISSQLDELSALTGDAFDSGSDIGEAEDEGIKEGIDFNSGMVKGAVETVVSDASSVDASGPGSTVGANFGSGVVAGIQSKISDAITKARELIAAAKDAADAEAQSASPSKEMIKRGQWFGEGFAIGIMNMVADVAEASSKMVESSKDSVDRGLQVMSDTIENLDWDVNPVITPVLDTSQIEDGMDRVNGLFPETQLIGNSWLGRSGMFGQNGGDILTQNTTNNYEITLDWKAGMDANAMLIELNSALKSRKMLRGV